MTMIGSRAWIRPLLRAVVLVAIGAVVATAVTLEATNYRRSSPAAEQAVDVADQAQPPAGSCHRRLQVLDTLLPNVTEILRRTDRANRQVIDATVETLELVQIVVDTCLSEQ